MIWHIVKKDLRLLWSAAALVAAFQLCAAIATHVLDAGAESIQLRLLATMLQAMIPVAVILAVISVVQTDPLPGTRQDWLIRPVRRAHLVLAKLVFIILLLQLPMWLVDVGAELVDGFSLPAAMMSAASRNLGMFCTYALPAILVAVVTRSLGEALAMAAFCLIAYMAVFLGLLSLLLGVKASIMDSGSHWMFTAGFDLSVLLGAAVVLTLQYSRRRTLLARWLVAAGGAVVMSLAFMPWPVAFGMQSALSPLPAASRPVQMAFNPLAKRFQLPLGAPPVLTTALQLPLLFSGLPADSVVLMDRADVRISAPDGTSLYRGTSNISVDGQGSIIWARFWIHTGPADAPGHPLFQRIYLPPEVYARLAHRQVRLSVDYSLTLFGQAAHYALPAVGGPELVPDLGRCSTAIDAEGDDLMLGCLSATRPASCATAYLEETGTGVHNYPVDICAPEYSPALFGQALPDAIYRTRGQVPFFDRSGLAHYPVDGSKLAHSRLVVTTFRPLAHFTRHVDTPALQLQELTGQTATSPAKH